MIHGSSLIYLYLFVFETHFFLLIIDDRALYQIEENRNEIIFFFVKHLKDALLNGYST